MCADSHSPIDSPALEQRLIAAIGRAHTLDDIETALAAEERVTSVERSAHLLKSNPPQREIAVDFRMDDGGAVKKIVTIYDLGDGRFQFHNLRDAAATNSAD